MSLPTVVKVKVPFNQTASLATGEARLDQIYWKIDRLEKKIAEVARAMGVELHSDQEG